MQEKTALFLGSQEVKQNLAGQATLSPHWAVVAQFRAETEVEQARFMVCHLRHRVRIRFKFRFRWFK